MIGLGRGLHSCPWTGFGMRIYKQASASAGLIQNSAPNWQLFGEMSIFNKDFGLNAFFVLNPLAQTWFYVAQLFIFIFGRLTRTVIWFYKSHSPRRRLWGLDYEPEARAGWTVNPEPVTVMVYLWDIEGVWGCRWRLYSFISDTMCHHSARSMGCQMERKL